MEENTVQQQIVNRCRQAKSLLVTSQVETYSVIAAMEINNADMRNKTSAFVRTDAEYVARFRKQNPGKNYTDGEILEMSDKANRSWMKYGE